MGIKEFLVASCPCCAVPRSLIRGMHDCVTDRARRTRSLAPLRACPSATKL